MKVVILSIVSLLIFSCASVQTIDQGTVIEHRILQKTSPNNTTAKGALVGATVGAGAGAVGASLTASAASVFKGSVFNFAPSVGVEYYLINMLGGAILGGVTGAAIGHSKRTPDLYIQYKVQPDQSSTVMTIRQYDDTPIPIGIRVLIQEKNQAFLLTPIKAK